MRIPGVHLIVMAFGAFLTRPFRTALTMLGIIIGVTAVFVSLSLGEGGKEKIRENLDSVNARTMRVYPNWSGRSSRQRPWRPFTESDLLDIQSLNGIFAATGELNRQIMAVSESSDWNATVEGIDTSFLKAKELEIERGIEISDQDIESGATVAVIGPSAARSLFPNQDPVGQRVKIQNIPFRIIGLTSEKGEDGWRGRDANNFILIPRTTARERIFGDNRLARQQVRGLVIVGETQAVLKQIEKDVDLILRRSRGLTPDEPPDYRIFNFSANRQAAANIMQTINLIVLVMGGVALVVGGVGVMNIMLASVTERTREIGLKKALGARRSDILMQFLTEAVLLTLLSGLIGLMGGYVIAQQLASLDDLNVKYTASVIALAFGASFLTGVISGFIPAFNASRLDPVEALRNE